MDRTRRPAASHPSILYAVCLSLFLSLSFPQFPFPSSERSRSHSRVGLVRAVAAAVELIAQSRPPRGLIVLQLAAH